MDTLEKVIIDPLSAIRNTLSVPSVPQDLSDNHLIKFFVALVAPSLAGKTQSAFVMNFVKPLYFSFDPKNEYKVQYIYKNFSSLSTCLKYCAEKDLGILQNLAQRPERNVFATTTSTDTISGSNQPTIQNLFLDF